MDSSIVDGVEAEARLLLPFLRGCLLIVERVLVVSQDLEFPKMS